ncbi:MAG TPA: tRNA epoxyqueuosine(34) reductase QueG [Promineifilum sp.]|nr:tRNA epoxyqueuosine(34) reductase QueG [Promineifilum sp.]HRO90344.1 tRNA epoxyqueuosine(34) reductase QueG [Promineifilum sp.]HRQ14624.1 tRNA epoxyqueuosine(34) reductase QueG [Promineifilum sp.]
MSYAAAKLTETLRERAAALGFNRVGVIPAGPARRLDAYLRRIADGMHGEMGYMARPDRVERRRDPGIILPGVRSFVVVGLDYYTAQLPPALAADPSRGRISNYAWGVDYHDVMTPRLEALAGWLRAQPGAGEVASRVYVDTGAILERDHGETAGLGFTGKNTLLIDPRHGSWFFLGVLLTTQPLDYDPPSEAQPEAPSCGSCTRCLTACPTSAFPKPYVLDARRCISYLTIELKNWIPIELRPLMGNWVYGCDVCQEVCPFNRFARPVGEEVFRAAGWNTAAPPLLDLLALDDDSFARRFANSPIKRIKRARLVRNACVAAGNWGSREAVAPLVRLLGDAGPLVRGHAAWALGRIGGEAAHAALAAAHATETDEDVRRELAAAG